MRTLTIRILNEEAALAAMQERFINAWKTGEYSGEFLS